MRFFWIPCSSLWWILSPLSFLSVCAFLLSCSTFLPCAGGLAPGVLLAQFLDVRYNETLCVKSYHGTNERSDVELVKGIAQVCALLLCPCGLSSVQPVRYIVCSLIHSFSDGGTSPPQTEQEVLDCQGEGFVVVDDLSDSGETLRFARSLVPKAVFCTVYSKPKGASAPDFFAREIPQDEVPCRP